jgi:hypothetical protein
MATPSLSDQQVEAPWGLDTHGPTRAGATRVAMLETELLPYSELPANATRYELLRVVSSSADRQAMWTAWSAISFLTAFCSCSLCIAVLSSRKARASVFNLYLAAFILPDFVFSFFCFITCLVNASHGHYVGGGMCEWQVSARAGGARGRRRGERRVAGPRCARVACSMSVRSAKTDSMGERSAPPNDTWTCAAGHHIVVGQAWACSAMRGPALGAPITPPPPPPPLPELLPHLWRHRLLLAQRGHRARGVHAPG